MKDFGDVATEQKAYICAVHSFIVKLLRAVLPDVAFDNVLMLGEDELARRLDGIISSHGEAKKPNAGDCCLAMAQAACVSMKDACDLLKTACVAVGLEKIAGRYLDAPWFIKVLLRKDMRKLTLLQHAIDFSDIRPSRILMNAAAILDNKAVAYDSMNDKAKRRADSETAELLRKVADGVESLHVKMDAHSAETQTQFAAVRDDIRETKEALLEKAEAILTKAVASKLSGKRRSKHTAEQKKVCLACWMEAQRNEELKSGTETGKATYEAAFNWYKRQLSLVGVTKLSKFIDVLHTINNTQSASNIKALGAKREAERKARKNPKQPPLKELQKNPNTRKTKCGIIRGMKERERDV